MLILSIDVGIKTLSHCLFRIDNGHFTILLWDIIDLTNNDTLICTGITKQNKPCGKSAKYKKCNQQYCLTHVKSSPYSLPIKELRNLSSCKLQHLKDLCNTYSIIVEKNDTKKSLMKRIKEYKESIELLPIQKINAKIFNLVDLGKTLSEKYSDLFDEYNIDTVLIENQIGPLAIRMKSIQGMVTQYWIMKGIYDIHFISASNKLKPFLQGSSTYIERKAKSIEIAMKCIKDHPGIQNWNDVFLLHKKKDDLADALLQGLWYIRQNDLAKLYIT